MIILSPAEQGSLRQLVQDGAWSDAEAARLPILVPLIEERLLARIPTVIGWLTVLTPRGMTALGIPRRHWHSVGSRLNDAYVRLSLQTLEWPLISDSPLHELDTSGRMVPAMTPFGPALVTGKMPAGYSPAGLREIRNRLKSTTLYHDFTVVCLTPSSRRGQTFAANNGSWCRVVHVVPGLPDLSGQGLPSRAGLTSDDSAMVPHGMHQQDYDYGDEWLKIMDAGVEERVAMFLRALKCDGVISAQQLQRHYALSHDDLPDVPCVEATLAPVHSRPDFLVNTRFYLLKKRWRSHQWTTHAHAATITEMRMMLDVPADPEVWKRSEEGGHSRLRANRRRLTRPDAIYMGEFGPEAIEADTGSYTTTVIERKISSFRDQGFDEIIWGVPLLQRRDNLSAAHPMRVLHARWF